MKLTIVGTGSKGNCYLFQSQNGETLIVECGVDFKEIKKALGFDLTGVVGCLVSHEHGDHCKAIYSVLNHGINVYSHFETLKYIGCEDYYNAKSLKVLEWQNVGSFQVLPFDVKHDAAAPLGFVVRHEEMGNTLFLTDSYFVEYKFDDLNNIIIEANYDIGLVSEGFLKNRIIKSHMSIEQCINTLKANDLTNVNHIVLIHLSDSNSNQRDFKKRVEQSTGKTVIIADNGLVIEGFSECF